MESRFNEAYDELNVKQKKAVDAIDGPVLVIAGPGTGKTQLLSLRAANIIRKTDTDPQHILCLTFTNHAASNMRLRLSALAGAEAQRIMVSTFHSFAADIMSSYPEYFWSGARMTLAPDAVQLEVIQTILAALPLDNPLAMKFADNFTAIQDVQQGLKLAKEAGLTPDKLRAIIDVNMAYIDEVEQRVIDAVRPTLSIKRLPELKAAVDALPEQDLNERVFPLISLSRVMKQELGTAIEADTAEAKCTQTGKWKRRWVQTISGQKGMFDERRRNAWWLALADVYATYRNALHSRGHYDYADMLVEVIVQLEQQPVLLSAVQERYLYVLIDEFQDTNAAQLRLAQLVAEHPNDENRPNLMAVGDDDQTIFAFNGAELNNMLAFKRIYPTTEIIVLEQNYRSHQTVLDAANTVIEHAEDRLVYREEAISKHLKAAASPTMGVLEHRVYPTRPSQYASVADEVASRWQSAPDESIAVLARSHESLRQISSQLNQHDIPIRYEQQNNVIEQEVAQICLTIANTVVHIGRGDKNGTNSSLAKLLRHPMWGVEPEQLWRLATDTYPDGDWLQSLLDNQDPHLEAIGKWLIWLSQQAAFENVSIMFEYMFGLRAGEHLTSPVREHFLARDEVSNSYLAALSASNVLLSLTREFAESPEGTLEDFVRFISLNRDLGRVITDQSWFVSGERAVLIMTVHKAKGLEFDTVYLVDAIEDAWKPRHIGRKPPANLPLQRYGEVPDDYIRLLYVALTRAKKNFFATSFSNDEKSNAVLPTAYLLDAIPQITVDNAHDEGSGITVLEQTLRWPRLEKADERSILAERLEGYRLSATAFIQYLDVTTGGPHAFLERHILRVPEGGNAVSGYGSAMHEAMQYAQYLTNEGSFKLDKVIARYEEAVAKRLLAVSERERYIPHGSAILRHLFVELGVTLPLGARAEYALKAELGSSVRIGGTVDLMERVEDRLVITDYKTGKPLTNLSTKDQTKQIKAWRHRTQLTFYDLLVRAASIAPASIPIDNRIMYLEAETAKELVVKFSPEAAQVTMLTELVTAVWKRVCDMDFPDTRHYAETAEGIETFCRDLLNGDI